MSSAGRLLCLIWSLPCEHSEPASNCQAKSLGLDLQAEQLKGQSAGGVKSQAISRAWNSTLVLRQVFAKKRTVHRQFGLDSLASIGLYSYQVRIEPRKKWSNKHETDFDD